MRRLFLLALLALVCAAGFAVATAESELAVAEPEFLQLEDEVEVADETEVETEDEDEQVEEAADSEEEEVLDEAEFEEEEAAEDEAEDADEEEQMEADALVEMDEALVPAHLAARDICPRMDACPVCPFPRKVLNTPACIKAAVQYAKAYGDSDADAALANLDTVQNAFMAGVEWADAETRTSYNQRLQNRRHHMQILDAVRAGRRYVKGCPKLPDTMACPCPQLVMVANEKDTKHQALKRALTASENENNYDWSLPDAVRQAFMDGVALAERVRLVRFANAGVAPSEGSQQQQLQRVWETQNALAQHAKAEVIY